MTAVWVKGVPVRLGDTFLPIKAVRDIVPEGMAFLDVADPEDEKWMVLGELGVITDTASQSSEFWLSCLQGVMRQSKPQKNAVIKLYQRLSNCEIGNSW